MFDDVSPAQKRGLNCQFVWLMLLDFFLAIVIGIWSGFKFSRLWGLAAYDGTDG